MNATPPPAPRDADGPDDVPPMTEAVDGPQGAAANPTLGETLRRARTMLRMSLRAVEAATGNAVTNGYLSQIEKGAATRPSPNVLWHLAQVYGLDYGVLLTRAGHHLPRDQVAATDAQSVEGLPMSALADLTPDERAELAEYVQFLRFRRNAGDGGRAPGGRS